MGKKVIAASEIPDIARQQWKFRVVNSDVPNCGVLPSLFVFFRCSFF